jgi:hypothetical protein
MNGVEDLARPRRGFLPHQIVAVAFLRERPDRIVATSLHIGKLVVSKQQGAGGGAQ